MVRTLITEFSPRGVYYLEIACGENERAALDYLRHYRSPHMLGIDADYALRRDFGIHGWPTWVVIDWDGTIRFHGGDPSRQLTGLRQCLEQLLAERPMASSIGQAPQAGIAVPAQVLACRQARRERSPRLAVSSAGIPHVVFYSNRDGTNAVYSRRFNPQAQPAGDERLSPGGAEAYAPDCVFDPKGTLWVAWCGRHNRVYDIYVRSLREGQAPAVECLTASDDDAMSPKMAAGADGTVIVTYYKWALLHGVSRDRNIFARTFDPTRGAWGPEVEVSPHQPAMEDHTDPDVVVDRQGGAWVVWSYDYHPSAYRKPVDASEPTIFAARLDSNTVCAPLLVGATGRAIDLFPSAAFDSRGTLWCAWDCSEPSRGIRLARFSQGPGGFARVSAFWGRGMICSTPELSPAKANLLLLAWSQRGHAGPAQGRVILLNDGRTCAEQTITEDMDVLFPQTQQGPDGQIWVAYEKSGPTGSQIVLRRITRGLVPQT